MPPVCEEFGRSGTAVQGIAQTLENGFPIPIMEKRTILLIVNLGIKSMFFLTSLVAKMSNLRYLLAEVLRLRSAADHVATVMCNVDNESLWINVVGSQTVSNVNLYVIDACMRLDSSCKKGKKFNPVSNNCNPNKLIKNIKH